MNFTKYSFRQGEIILNSKATLKKEIEEILKDINVDFGYEKKGIPSLHRVIQKKFKEKSWKVEEKISDKDKRRFDIYNEQGKVGIELEFTNVAFIYRTFLKFLLGYNEDKIEIGVLITFDRKTMKSFKYERADIQRVIQELKKLRPIIGVPIWVLGVKR